MIQEFLPSKEVSTTDFISPYSENREIRLENASLLQPQATFGHSFYNTDFQAGKYYVIEFFINWLSRMLCHPLQVLKTSFLPETKHDEISMLSISTTNMMLQCTPSACNT